MVVIVAMTAAVVRVKNGAVKVLLAVSGSTGSIVLITDCCSVEMQRCNCCDA